MNKYEGMFLVDAKESKKGASPMEEQISALIAKCKGEVVRWEIWDERKLAYEIGGTTNGTYYLFYFSGGQDTISLLNREVKLSTRILRALFLRIKEIPEPGTFARESDEDSESGEETPRRRRLDSEDSEDEVSIEEDTDEAAERTE